MFLYLQCRVMLSVNMVSKLGMAKGKIPNTVDIRWLLYNVLLDDNHRNTIMEV
jgi:hypothetical protein